jgi:anti-sigma factor RsiW
MGSSNRCLCVLTMTVLSRTPIRSRKDVFVTDAMSGITESAHPTVEVLADAAEDLLSEGEARQVAGHVAGCADCAETVAALTAVRSVLQEAPAPRMPDAVFAQLQAVVRAESTRRASGAAEAEAEAAAVEAAKRTALGTFGQNPAVSKDTPIWTDDLAGK